jgi:hypothetical protein
MFSFSGKMFSVFIQYLIYDSQSRFSGYSGWDTWRNRGCGSGLSNGHVVERVNCGVVNGFLQKDDGFFETTE